MFILVPTDKPVLGPYQGIVSLHQIITENHNWSECREETVRGPAPTGRPMTDSCIKTHGASWIGDGKTARVTGSGSHHETVPPRNIREAMLKVSSGWVPKQHLIKDANNRHADIYGAPTLEEQLQASEACQFIQFSPEIIYIQVTLYELSRDI